MAGSRREAVGSIFKRVQGLLRSEAMKEEDRPIWYDVVKAFPPKPLPPQKKVQKILYPEDFVRVQFHKVYSFNGVTSLSNESSKSIPDKFVETYIELHQQQQTQPDELFEKTAQTLQGQGIRLIRHDEIPKEKDTPRVETKRKTPSEVKLDIDELFTEKT